MSNPPPGQNDPADEAVIPDGVGKPTPIKVNRRRFLGWSALGASAAAVGAWGISDAHSSGPRPTSTDREARTIDRSNFDPATITIRSHQPENPRASVAEPTTAPVRRVSLPTSKAIAEENAKTGHAWWVTTPQQAGDIQGYANQVSAVAGDTVTLFVDTKAAQFHVEAYRMGYYQGIGGRLIWQSTDVAGVRQPPPSLLSTTNTIECQWVPSLTVTIDTGWPPGAYLLKLVGATGEQQFVPLCVRDDSSRASIVVQHSVTTWQAYNRWGGYSLYYGNHDQALSFTHAPGGGSYEDRARVVSFDRPYDHDWASGAADFIGNELPVIYQAEQLGLDVTYWTDVDLHAHPELLNNHRGLVSLGHDEYWSMSMRKGAAESLATGVNLAFLGANACYRQIRLEPSPLGPYRHQVCYKSAAEDPMTHQDASQVTVNWSQAPVNLPEDQLIGSTYQDIQASADMVIADPSSWLFQGLTLKAGQSLAQVVQGEFDRYVPNGNGPANLDVIAHSIVPNRHNNYSDVTWYTVPGGGGVFATGNASWIGGLTSTKLIPPNVLPNSDPLIAAVLLQTMRNVYAVIGSGPASGTRPSTGNWRAAYATDSTAVGVPTTDSTA